MDSLERLENARNLTNLVCQIYKYQTQMDPDEAVLWNLSERVAEVIDCVLTKKSIDFIGLYSLCQNSANKTQVDRLSFAISALLIQLLSERDPEGELVAYMMEVALPDGSLIKDEEPDEFVAIEIPTTSTDDVKQEEVEEQTLEGWETRMPLIESPSTKIISESSKLRRSTGMEASDMEESTGHGEMMAGDAADFAATADPAATAATATATELPIKDAAEIKKEEEEEQSFFDDGTSAEIKEKVEDYDETTEPFHSFEGEEAANWEGPSTSSASSQPPAAKQTRVGWAAAAAATANHRSSRRNGRILSKAAKTSIEEADQPSTSATAIVYPKQDLSIEKELNGISFTSRTNLKRIRPAADVTRTQSPPQIETKKRGTSREQICFACSFITTSASEWREHLSQECPECRIRVPSCMSMDDHKGKCRAGVRFTKCTHSACDFRSSRADVLRIHEQSHSSWRRVENIAIGERCPFCPANISHAAQFVVHMVECHSKLVNSYSNVLKCNGYNNVRHGVCPFKCAKTAEMLRHWEKQTIQHGQPSLKFDYEFAEVVLKAVKNSKADTSHVHIIDTEKRPLQKKFIKFSVGL